MPSISIKERFLESKSGNSWLRLKVCCKIESETNGIETLKRKEQVYPAEQLRLCLIDDKGNKWVYLPERHAFRIIKGD